MSTDENDDSNILERGAIQRDSYFDVVRGFAVALMVLGHCIQYGSGVEFFDRSEYFCDLVFCIIYSFHMPLLMLLSGYFFYCSSCNKAVVEIVRLKVFSVLVPAVVWGAIFSIPTVVGHTLSGDILLAIKSVYWSIRGSLWFLWAIIIAMLIVLAVRDLGFDCPVIHIVIAIGLLFVPSQYISAKIVFMYPYFCIGYYFAKNNILNSIRYKLGHCSKRAVFACLAAIFVIMLFQYSTDDFVYTTGINLFESELGPSGQLVTDTFRFLIGLVGSELTLIGFSFIPKSILDGNLFSCFRMLGRLSIGIYAFSVMLSMPLLWVSGSIAEPIYILNVLEAICTLCITLLAIKLIQHFKFINAALLGGRK